MPLYIRLDLLHGLVAEVDCLRLLTELPEWLAVTPAASRGATASFISQHLENIRDVDALHAKLLLGDEDAYQNAANLRLAGHRSGSLFQQYHEPVVCRVAKDRHLRTWVVDEAFGA